MVSAVFWRRYFQTLKFYADISSPDFPGIYSIGRGFAGPRPNTETHPHMKLDQTMVSVPKVFPGDMVFWHCVRIYTGYIFVNLLLTKFLIPGSRPCS